MKAKIEKVDRKTAQAFNPMIGNDSAETMETCARMAEDLGYLASLGDQDVEVPSRHLYWLGITIAAALEYEVGKGRLGGAHGEPE